MSYLRETYFRVCINPHRSRVAAVTAGDHLIVRRPNCRLPTPTPTARAYYIIFFERHWRTERGKSMQCERIHEHVPIKLMIIIFNLGVSMPTHESSPRLATRRLPSAMTFNIYVVQNI